MMNELKQTERYLKDNGIESAHAESEYILRHLFNYNKINLYAQDLSLDDNQRKILHEVLDKRISGEPLQYILGNTEFYGLDIKIKKGVFIPRPETEILVDTVLKKMGSTPARELTPFFLDLCTGSGNIAISLTKTNPHYRIFASDISKKALELAKENALLNSISNNIEFRYGNLFKPWHDKKKFFSAIVCNPPYIRTGDLNGLPIDVKNEPKRALDGKKDGLYFYRKILKEASDYLALGGYVFFEISPLVSEGVREILEKGFSNIEIIKDYNGSDRIVIAQTRHN